MSNTLAQQLFDPVHVFIHLLVNLLPKTLALVLDMDLQLANLRIGGCLSSLNMLELVLQLAEPGFHDIGVHGCIFIRRFLDVLLQLLL